MTNNKEPKSNPGGCLGVILVSIVGPVLRISEVFIDFAHSLGIISDLGVSLVAGVFALLIGAVVIITSKRLIKSSQ